MKEKLRRLGERWPWLGRALDVQDRVGEINGGFVASGINVSIFVALFRCCSWPSPWSGSSPRATTTSPAGSSRTSGSPAPQQRP
ncbi:MAG: hypothetical protein R2746_00825 [Acidimicrobiales bacterium]